MRIRPATLADIDRCVAVDGSSTTTHVWHMEEADQGDQVAVSFTRTRLPRPMVLEYPRSIQDLYEDWKRVDCYLVADELVTVYGFLTLSVSHWQWSGMIEHLIVGPAFRRRKIATGLLGVAEQWARGSGLRSISAAVQPKNDPGIQFLRANGFAYCGHIDSYFSNSDGSMLFARDL